MRKILPLLPLILVLALTILSCSKSRDQKDFEEDAYAFPKNYTAMTVNGERIPDGTSDPDDWRIAPMYQGLVTIVTPAYPNPVSVNSDRLKIDIGFNGLESVPGLVIYSLEGLNDIFGPLAEFDQSELPPGTKTLLLNPGTLPMQGQSGLIRLLIMDSRNNVITYGDIQLE